MINPQLAKSVMMWWLQCLIWWSNAPVFHKLAPIAHLKFTDRAFCSSAPTTATSGRSKSSLDLWMARVSPHIAIQSYSMLQYSYVNYQQKNGEIGVIIQLSNRLGAPAQGLIHLLMRGYRSEHVRTGSKMVDMTTLCSLVGVPLDVS